MEGKWVLLGGIVIGLLLAVNVYLFSKKQNPHPDTTSDDQLNLTLPQKIDQDKLSQATQEATKTETMKKKYNQPPELQIDQTKNYSAQITTSTGPLNINLFTQEVPNTVNNFVFLSREGFYRGTVFHRILKDFMIQGGDPNGDGSGGPGYKFADEPITRDYSRGIVAMANAGPNTNGSQFFIMTQDTDLEKNYVIFGELADEQSLKTLDAIASTPVVANATGEVSKPTQAVTIQSVTITEN